MGEFAFNKPPYYTTILGSAYLGDCLEFMRQIDTPDGKGIVNLIMTSPPFALLRKKDYGNVGEDEYIAWFMPFAAEFRRLLADV